MQMILAGLPPHHVEMPSDCGLYPCPIMGVITSFNPVFTMPTPHGLQCRPMTAEDVSQVLALQHTCYQPEFHEPVQAFDSKLRSSPDTCWVISTRAASIAAYLVCLPVARANYPTLRAPSWQPVADADELYVHDMAISPDLRGQGAAHLLLQQATTHAALVGLSRLSLIAVQDSTTFWAHLGFTPQTVTSLALQHKLASFGAEATLMTRQL
jgi:GNAT superfamily N-acetyltransferase